MTPDDRPRGDDPPRGRHQRLQVLPVQALHDRVPGGRLRRPSPGPDRPRRPARRPRVDHGRQVHLALHRLPDLQHALPAGDRRGRHHGRAAHARLRARPGAQGRPVREHPQVQRRLLQALGPHVRARAARARQDHATELDDRRPHARGQDGHEGQDRLRAQPRRRPRPDEAHGRCRRAHRESSVAPARLHPPAPAREARHDRPRLLPRLLAAQHGHRDGRELQGHLRGARPRAPRDPRLGVLRQHRGTLDEPPARRGPAGQRARQGQGRHEARRRGRALRRLLQPLHDGGPRDRRGRAPGGRRGRGRRPPLRAAASPSGTWSTSTTTASASRPSRRR